MLGLPATRLFCDAEVSFTAVFCETHLGCSITQIRNEEWPLAVCKQKVWPITTSLIPRTFRSREVMIMYPALGQ
jgi:hypothetical protein